MDCKEKTQLMEDGMFIPQKAGSGQYQTGSGSSTRPQGTQALLILSPILSCC